MFVSKAAVVHAKFGYAFAVFALVLASVMSVAPARAATITDIVTFSVTGSYPTNGGCCYDNGSASGSFDITFDPTLAYPDQSISGVISNLVYTVTDPLLGGNITSTLNPISSFTLNYGVLTLYSNYAADQGKNFTDTPDIVIGINGFPTTPPIGVASAIWYSADSDGNTLTASGSATIESATPLPDALPLFATGLGAMGLFGWRKKRKNAVAVATAGWRP
jgi:hypothetical protein